VHDISDLEGRGIPGVLVASVEFAHAAEIQAAALGFEPAAVFVPHPIQNRTDNEIKAISLGAVEAILGAICSS
jgi:hypothetical protein